MRNRRNEFARNAASFPFKVIAPGGPAGNDVKGCKEEKKSTPVNDLADRPSPPDGQAKPAKLQWTSGWCVGWLVSKQHCKRCRLVGWKIGKPWADGERTVSRSAAAVHHHQHTAMHRGPGQGENDEPTPTTTAMASGKLWWKMWSEKTKTLSGWTWGDRSAGPG